MAECFICMETDNSLYKVCRCDTVVHAECLRRLVNSTPSHSTNCAVCREAYDISTTSKRSCQPTASQSKFTCQSVIIFTAVLGGSIGILIFLDPYQTGFKAAGNILLFYMLVGLTTGLVIAAAVCIVMALITHVRSTGHICCYKQTIVVINREINLSNISPVQIHPLYVDELES